jgi:hypothetical protein
LKRAIGNVWGGCDAVAKAALDNKGALFKALAGVMAVLKDTLREVWGAGWGSMVAEPHLKAVQRS